MYELIRGIINDPYLSREIEELAWKIQQIGLLFGGIFFAMNWLWNAGVKMSKLDVGKWWGPEELLRGIVLYVFLAWYPLIMQVPQELINLMTKAVQVDESEYRMAAENYAKLEEAYYDPDNPGFKDNLDENGRSTGGVEPEDNDLSFWQILRGGNFGLLLLNSVAFIIAQIISVVVQAIAVMVGKVLYVIGPLSITFSMLPMFKDRLGAWFRLWVNTQLVFLTIVVLDSIFVALFQTIGEYPIIGMPNGILLFNIVMIILYALVFWLTSLYAGSDSSSKVLSTGVAAATALLGAGLTAGAGGFGGGSGGGVLGKVMSSGKSAAGGGSVFDKQKGE